MDDEILEQEPTVEETSVVQEPEPLIIETKGKFQPFEAMTGQTFEVGKTYNIKVAGVCEFAISEDRPQAGLKTNEISYTKNSDTLKLWIKTGGN